MLYANRGELTRAVPLFERALELEQRVLGADHPTTGRNLLQLARTHRRLGNWQRAAELYRRSLEINEEALGADNYVTGIVRLDLGILAIETEKLVRAEAYLQRALAVLRTADPSGGGVARCLSALGELHLRRGASDQAGALFREALTNAESAPRALVWQTRNEILHRLAESALRHGDAEQALALYQQAADGAREPLGDDPGHLTARHSLAVSLAGLGTVRQALGDPRRAEEHWNAALAAVEGLGTESGALRFLSTEAEILLHLDRPADARPLVEKLLSKDWTDPRFLTLCRERGLCPPE